MVKYRTEVLGVGEDTWSSNNVEYKTKKEAMKWLDDLRMRWFGYDVARVVPVSTPKDQKFNPSKDIVYQDFRGTSARKSRELM